ncbi:MAG: hypothetical protein D6744_13190 [Planctomycetota bacterium]|nr:MAG: hypothetical protein D6744_13190 [Planctomycetota bacterium]
MVIHLREMQNQRVRIEALRLLEGDSAILDTARAVSRVLRERGVAGAVIGGVATYLHGYTRTTADVDVLLCGCDAEATEFRAALEAVGFVFDAEQCEFNRDGVPVHIVRLEQAGVMPREMIDLLDVRTVGLADLLNMKLRTGARLVTRAQDLADVVGLIRANRLDAGFARRITPKLRPEFRKLLRAIERGE